MKGDLAVMTLVLRNPLPPASGTTIIGIATGVGVVSSMMLRHFGFSAEAALTVSGTEAAVWLVCHPQVNRSVPVLEAPPNQALPEAQKAFQCTGADTSDLACSVEPSLVQHHGRLSSSNKDCLCPEAIACICTGDVVDPVHLNGCQCVSLPSQNSGSDYPIKT